MPSPRVAPHAPGAARSIAIAGGLLAFVAALAAIVGDRPASGLERELTVRARQLPDWAIDAFGPPMELGTVDVAYMLAVLIAIGFGFAAGVRTIVTILLVAEAAPALKRAVERPRLTVAELGDAPLEAVRSFAYPSSHAAVAFAVATAVLLVDRRWGRIALVLATVVAVGRLAIGVHTLADVVGGAALGAAIALLVHAAARGLAAAETRVRDR